MKPAIFGGLFNVAFALPAAAVDFEKDVLPILKSNCIDCHKEGKEKGDLNLEPHKLKSIIGSGLKIVPGKPSSGLLIKVIQSEDPDTKMPPKGSPLSEEEVETLKMWISEGAELGRFDPDAKPAEPAPGAPAAVPVAVWTNKAGKEIKATLMSVEDGKAVLKMENGKIYKYPIDQLSEDSQAKVKEFAEKAG